MSLTITPRDKDFSKWYLDVIAGADLAEHSSVKGAMVIKPWGFAIWENIQQDLDSRFKALGVKNAYFPLFIPQSFLQKEAEHVEGFSPELAIVTEAGGKKLDEPLVVRPTSETIIYDTFSRWIQSYRDLPILINQWANIVRWEMRTRLFLRTSEFLWQEGHTAHVTSKEAEERTLTMLEVYRRFAEEMMAMPVSVGEKSESERFAGAVRTYSVEALMQDGKALQAGTSHFLGQNFAKSFDVKFASEEGKEEYAWQTSWGVSTRLIGGLIMVHGDDKGLVLPPKLAPVQIIVIPAGNEDGWASSLTVSKEQASRLQEIGIKVEVDERSHLRFGEKLFEWEKKGVPLRIEIGPRDIENEQAVVARRDTGEKETVPWNQLPARVSQLLEEIQVNLFEKASRFMDEMTKEVSDYEQLKEQVQTGLALGNWCGDIKCEQKVQSETKATIRNIPFKSQDSISGHCVVCQEKEAKHRALWARSY